MRFASLPSGVIVQIASNQLAAKRLLSGARAASRTPVGPAPDAGCACSLALWRDTDAPAAKASSTAIEMRLGVVK
jgi:hypothetical protein